MPITSITLFKDLYFPYDARDPYDKTGKIVFPTKEPFVFQIILVHSGNDDSLFICFYGTSHTETNQCWCLPGRCPRVSSYLHTVMSNMVQASWEEMMLLSYCYIIQYEPHYSLFDTSTTKAAQSNSLYRLTANVCLLIYSPESFRQAVSSYIDIKSHLRNTSFDDAVVWLHFAGYA